MVYDPVNSRVLLQYRLRFLTGDVAADAVGRHPAHGTPAGSAAIDSAANDSTANATSDAPAAVSAAAERRVSADGPQDVHALHVPSSRRRRRFRWDPRT